MHKGIIFSRDEEKSVVMVGNKLTEVRRSVVWLNRIGKLMILLAVGAIIGFLWPIIREEAKYAFGQTKAGKVAERVANTEMKMVIGTKSEIENLPNWIVPDREYSIYIPKILAKARVIGNVNAADKSVYSAALKEGVAEAAGLAHPGERGTTYLFAHSAGNSYESIRYNAIFYLLNKMEPGDEVEIVYKDKLHKYQVETREIIAAEDVKYFDDQKEEEKLVLQTCYPPGTAWKRLIVVAKPV